MKNLLILFFLAFLANTAFGQDVKLALSPEILIEDKKVLTGQLHSDKTGHWMGFMDRPSFFRPSTNIYLEKYDNNFKKVFSKRYTVDRDRVYSLGMKYFKGKFVWIQYEEDAANDQLIYYAIPIDLNGKAGKPKKIAKFKFENFRDAPYISWKVSQDTSRILFFAELDNNRAKDDYSFYVSVIDNDFNKLWDNKVRWKESQKQVDASAFELGDNNDVYFTAKIFDSNASAGALRKRYSREAEFSVNLVIVTENEDKRYKLNLGNKFIKGIKIVQNPFGSDIACAAMIGDSQIGPIQGISYFKIDSKTGDILYAKKRNFSDKELDSFGRKNTSRDRRSGDRGLDAQFLFKDVIYKEDGSYTILAEEYREIIMTNNNPNGGSSTNTRFVNNHIIVSNFAADGEVENISLIPKKFQLTKSGFPQRDPNLEEVTHYMFFSTLNTGDNIYFLYNDDKTNFTRNITDPDRYKTVTRYNECVAVIAHIDEFGKLQRKELFTRRDTGTLLMPKFSVEISQNEMLIFLKRKKFMAKDAFRFGILSVD